MVRYYSQNKEVECISVLGLENEGANGKGLDGIRREWCGHLIIMTRGKQNDRGREIIVGKEVI